MIENSKSSFFQVAVVDDSKSITKFLATTLSNVGYSVQAFTDSEDALRTISNQPPDLVLTDINMPKLNGYELCTRLKSLPEFKFVPVLIVSTEKDKNSKVQGFRVGAQDYITKPFEEEELLARVETHLHLSAFQKKQVERSKSLSAMVQSKVEEITQAQQGVIKALAKLAEFRDEDTGNHLFRVAEYCRLLGYGLLEREQYAITKSFIDIVAESSSLHDIGKVAIPDSILLKPGKLTADEFEIMKTHAEVGARTIKSTYDPFYPNSYLTMGASIALSHHEKWDGSGYPMKLAGDCIPVCGRIMAIADVYDALRSKRVYKPGFSHEKACEIIKKDTGSHFDPLLAGVFIKHHKKFDQVWQKFEG